jgi:hypothetical protein
MNYVGFDWAARHLLNDSQGWPAASSRSTLMRPRRDDCPTDRSRLARTARIGR